MLPRHKAGISEHGEDLPEVRDWRGQAQGVHFERRTAACRGHGKCDRTKERDY